MSTELIDTETRDALDAAEALRELARFIEEHPRFKPYIGTYFILAHDGADFAELVRTLGPGFKGADDDSLRYTRSFGPPRAGVNLCVFVPKDQTCERVQVGTKTVEVEVYPDDVKPTIVRTEEPVYEWKCPESFLAIGAGSVWHEATP